MERRNCAGVPPFTNAWRNSSSDFASGTSNFRLDRFSLDNDPFLGCRLSELPLGSGKVRLGDVRDESNLLWDWGAL